MLNKKGSMMVESAIIYPIVIAAVIALIYIVICTYMGCLIKANLNMELRRNVFASEYVGKEGFYESNFSPYDKYGKKAFSKKIKVSKLNIYGKQILYGTVSNTYSGNALILNNQRRIHESRVYVIDEKDYIRKVDMIIP